MTFWLSSTNIFDYLRHHRLIQEEQGQTDYKVAKNFNLVLELSNGQRLLIKQPRYSPGQSVTDELLSEWRIQELMRKFPELNPLQSLVPEVIHFDLENSIVVSNYLTDYDDLFDFYRKDAMFSTSLAHESSIGAIATNLGQVLATIHQLTFQQPAYQDFLTHPPTQIPAGHPLYVLQRLERITPEVFGLVPADGLKFYALYQKYDRLQGAIAELIASYTPCCVTHNDIKFNNILLHQSWQSNGADRSEQSMIRFIDWERCGWGDPAFDLGMLVGHYLLFWLSSLVVSKTIAIEDSLRLALVPLENLQPSLAALVTAYLQQFPEVLESRPDFLSRTVQFAGVALLLQIQSTLQHSKVFGNSGICMLQVAKGLLCRAEQSIPTVFGVTAAELLPELPALASR